MAYSSNKKPKKRKNLTHRIELKITQETYAGLMQIHANHGIKPQVLLREMADAAIKFREINGHFTFPIHLSTAEQKLTLTGKN